MTKGSSLHFAAIDNKEECDKVNTKYSSLNNFINDDPFLDDDDDNVIINQRYLLDQEKKLDDDTIVCDTVNNFFEFRLCIFKH